MMADVDMDETPRTPEAHDIGDDELYTHQTPLDAR